MIIAKSVFIVKPPLNFSPIFTKPAMDYKRDYKA